MRDWIPEHRLRNAPVQAYTPQQLQDIALRGRADPASLTDDEIRALCLWLAQVKQRQQ